MGLIKIANQFLDNLEESAEEYNRQGREYKEQKKNDKNLGNLAGTILGGGIGIGAGSLLTKGKNMKGHQPLAQIAGGSTGALLGGEKGKEMAVNNFDERNPKLVQDKQDAKEDYDAATAQVFQNEDEVVDELVSRAKRGELSRNAPEGIEGYLGSPLDEETSHYFEKYPDLFGEAIKKDTRKDRGGILHHFTANVHPDWGNSPEREEKVKRLMELQLQKDDRIGWRGQIRDDVLDDEIQRYSNMQ